MSRYRNSRDPNEGLDELLKERNPEGGDPGRQPDAGANPEEELNSEEKSWKKRHGDLRRHSSKKEDELKNKIKELESQVEQSNKANMKFPADEREFNEWITKYPVVSKMVDTLVQKRIIEGNGMLEGRFDRVKQLEEEIANSKLEREKEKAYREIKKVHPDFDKLVEDDDFQKWIESQANWVQDALWENETDAQSAIDAVDLYKARNNKGKREKEREIENASGSRRSTSEAPTGGSDAIYTESQVNKMSQNEYERHEEKIREAIRDGRFKYDLSVSS